MGKGCQIYLAKPPSCGVFNCLWLLDEKLGPEWQPSKSKIVLVRDARNHRIIAYVDATTPTAWKRSPYFEKLRDWMLAGMTPDGDSIFVSIAGKVTLLLPDGEHPLGVVGDDDIVEVQMMPTGNAYRAVVRKRNPMEATKPVG